MKKNVLTKILTGFLLVAVAASMTGCTVEKTVTTTETHTDADGNTTTTTTVTDNDGTTTTTEETSEEPMDEELMDEEMIGDAEPFFDYPSNAMEEREGKTSFESYEEV